MPAQPRSRRARRTRERRWDQISFLDDAGIGETGSAAREAEDALGLADHAADPGTGREALDRLYQHLAQRAIRRGRTPIPKHNDSQSIS
jgi:hypothetical protein